LMKNAREAYRSEGRVVVRTAASARGPRSGLLVSVRDEGCGMSPRVQERALDEFFTTKAEGSGLGLAFVKRVVEAHEGELTIASEEGRGTTVSLWLPS